MPRQKLSEYRAKRIISEALELPYAGWQIDAEKPLQPQLDVINSETGQFVVKVDEGVKGRFKQGLVLLNVATNDLTQAISTLTSKNYRWLIIEPHATHEQTDERYISLMVEKDGNVLLKYTASGGVDIEAHSDSIKNVQLHSENSPDWEHIASEMGISSNHLQRLLAMFEDNYFVFMEINPYIAIDSRLLLLDAAVEVDDAAEFFVDNWTSEDFRRHSDRPLTPEEKIVLDLDANSPASFKLSILEPNGSIFLLLSGGGASVVVADEIYNQGHGKQLANYGEYSGNPNTEETYIYTKALLQLLLQSSAPHKVLFIGGAVANFTDIAKTFAGVIQAIEELLDALSTQQIKVFVRRGGPNQEIGLDKIEAVLKKNHLLGAVHGPEVPLTAAVTEALQEIANE